MKATDMLKKQHREVAALFKSALNSDKTEERRDALAQIVEKLTMHTTIEEEIFYPAFRDAADSNKGNDLALEAYEEHHVVKLLLEEVPDIDPDDESFDAKVTVLKEIVEHHVEEEQDSMFPMAEKKLGAERLKELAEEMQARMSEIEGAGSGSQPAMRERSMRER
jgi:hemerythrin-like domain-containing protein